MSAKHSTPKYFSAENNKSKNFLIFCFSLILIGSLCSSCHQNNYSIADLVLKNGSIYTVDNKRTIAEAVAIKDGKFVYVGTNNEVNKYIGKETKVIDLDKRMVLPGFIDSHCHPAYGAAHELFDVNFNGLNSIEDYQKAIKDFVAKHPDAKFIKGRGWKNTLFSKTGPDKKFIDEIIKDIPVSLSDEGGHSQWVNSKTLELAGITKETKDPPGGVIEKDPGSGEPTGTLRENAADLVAKFFPEYTVDQLVLALESYQKMAASFGITTAHDASVDAGGNDFNAYKNLEKENRLTMRFRASLYVDPAKGIEQIKQLITEREKNKGSFFLTNGAKIFIDGVVEGSTAYLKESYKHLPGSRGEFFWKADDLNKICAELDKNKFQIHVHSIGDAATSVTLDAFEFVQKKNGKRDSRNLITHLQLVDPKEILRFKELGVIAVPQPYWFMKDDYYYNIQVPYLGQKRADMEYPMESFFKAGVMVASASDYAVTIPCNPLNAIQTGITRSKLNVIDPKEILWQQERASLDQMIASFTINGAYANFIENTIGSIETGKLADIIVLDKNLFNISVNEICKTKVLLTLFEGKEVFRDSSFK
ncbi:MAG: amidohydrolase [Ignavibacteriales bacterium]|nr:amidohydrolase [Ignavibacteriales bacterium]